MTSAGPRTRGGKRGIHSAENIVAKKKEETRVGKPLSFLDEENIGYSFLIQPVKTSFKKFESDLRALVGGSTAQPTKTAKENTTDLTNKDQQTENAAKDLQKSLSTKLQEFSAKLITAESIKTSAYISLPLPTQIPRDQLSVSYSVEDIGAYAGSYGLGQEASDRMENGGALAPLGAVAGSYVIRTLLQGLAKGVSTAFFGNVPNPFAANIFENVDTRSFTFDWVFQPKSETEAIKLREIINQLRYYALPQPKDLLLELPHEFNLAFQGTDFLYAFSRCVLSNIEVSHAPNGFNVFTTADAPQSIALSLTFKEIFPLNKDVIMNFGNPSMTPQQLIGEAEIPSTSQSDAASETVVANSQLETEKQINQQVADWKAKEIQRNKLVAERERIDGYAPFQDRLAQVNKEITQLEIDMNLTATEVQSLQAKINYTDRTGKKLKPLPLRP